MSDEELARVDDGRVFTGRQSIPLKLADALGGEREAIDWLISAKRVPKNLPVRDYSPGAGFAGLRLKSLARRGAAFRAARFGEAGSVDGLISIWQMTAGN